VSRTLEAATRLARRTALAQLVAGLAAGLVVGVIAGPAGAGSAALGAGSVLLGTLLMARATVGAGVVTATSAMLRLVVAMVAKWGLVVALGALAIGVLKLPPLPFLAGMVVAIAAAAVVAVRRQ